METIIPPAAEKALDYSLTQVDVDTLFQFASSILLVQIFILAALILVLGLLFGLALTKNWNV